MILSRKYRFIFLHNPKAAGSSVTVTLSRYLGPWDVQIGLHQDAIEYGIVPNVYSFVRMLHPRVGCGLTFLRWFLAYSLKHKLSTQRAYGQAFTKAVKRSLRHVLGAQATHLCAERVRKQYSIEWRDYLKFCVVRNPWDRVVSDYHWRFREKANVPSFSEWVQAAFGHHSDTHYRFYGIRDSRAFYRIDGKLAVDYVIKYENLSNDLEAVCNRVGLEWDGWLPNKKGNIRKNKDYRTFYDTTTRRCIWEFYRQDIEEFDYEF